MNTGKKSVIITGGTSGIGLALAAEFARRGYAVGITGRDAQRLAAAGAAIGAAGTGAAQVRRLDVCDYDANFAVIRELTEALGGHLDILVANAGVGGGKHTGVASFAENRACIETNVLGAMATLSAGADIMRSQKSGQLVGISSVAGFRGLPGGAAYSASKAALSTYLEALRGEVYRHGVNVTAIEPGYIDTPLNRAMKSRPFLITVETGARIIADRIEGRAYTGIVPWFPWALLGILMRSVPKRIWTRLTALPAKHK